MCWFYINYLHNKLIHSDQGTKQQKQKPPKAVWHTEQNITFVELC